uniref:Calpain catalytic domain-containing protein n=1 Tax=Chromera velia CCMP2878 TaxID=1169474 RepID=A0A0G4F9L1_9ALVE|eukprot:Cvel_15905.t1-p1 / transcript=Cvel_15905.t1 / gene=Cvel_15905 / organism=Chromera_velia_CCMP2878 / gene_product=Calpain, putative / transcript_product=Calpain, putative / location=Cvel_scaffold1202:20386-24198(-) / protein_length=586 / sequence_SO=supercontig / SO=protein_coding / is_pseudo=false
MEENHPGGDSSASGSISVGWYLGIAGTVLCCVPVVLSWFVWTPPPAPLTFRGGVGIGADEEGSSDVEAEEEDWEDSERCVDVEPIGSFLQLMRLWLGGVRDGSSSLESSLEAGEGGGGEERRRKRAAKKKDRQAEDVHDGYERAPSGDEGGEGESKAKGGRGEPGFLKKRSSVQNASDDPSRLSSQRGSMKRGEESSSASSSAAVAADQEKKEHVEKQKQRERETERPAMVFVEKFRDPDFPPSDDSFGERAFEDVWPIMRGRSPEWVRASELGKRLKVRPPEEFLEDIEPTDIKQGSIGTCWLIAAIAGIGEFPSSVKSLFPDQTRISMEGRYKVRLYNPVARQWQLIEIDDFVPCWRGRPLSSSSDECEIWCLLLEKAVAKLAGSYSQIIGGSQGKAWILFTGAEETWVFHNALGRSQWEKKKLKTRCESLEEYFGQSQMIRMPTPDLRSSAEFFEEIKRFDSQDFLMGAFIVSASGQEEKRDDGLVAGHAYTLLSAFEVQGVKFVQLRNPWGDSTEWKGRWCDDDPRWDENPELKIEVEAFLQEVSNDVSYTLEKNDGAFLMEFEDFDLIWTFVSVCPHTMKK